MQQHAASIAFGDLAQAAPTSPPGMELDLARILDRQDMTPADRSWRLQAPAFNQLIDRDLRIVHKPPERHVRSPVAPRHLAQTDAACAKHSPEKRRPLLSRRTSPNSPKDKSGSCCISDAPSNQSVRKRKSYKIMHAQSYHDAQSQSVACQKSVDALARRRGPITPDAGDQAGSHATIPLCFSSNRRHGVAGPRLCGDDSGKRLPLTSP